MKNRLPPDILAFLVPFSFAAPAYLGDLSGLCFDSGPASHEADTVVLGQARAPADCWPLAGSETEDTDSTFPPDWESEVPF